MTYNKHGFSGICVPTITQFSYMNEENKMDNNMESLHRYDIVSIYNKDHNFNV